MLGTGISLASFRRFCAVAARRNSSRAPFGPPSRSRSSLRMRLRWANNISTFLRNRREVRPSPEQPLIENGGRELANYHEVIARSSVAKHNTRWMRRGSAKQCLSVFVRIPERPRNPDFPAPEGPIFTRLRTCGSFQRNTLHGAAERKRPSPS